MSSHDISFAPPRGMRDFYPEDMAVRNMLFDEWRRSSLLFGFSHYDACVVESMDLLRRKAGEEISEQTYNFQDKSGRELALRPEMTPTLARMVAARQGALSFPIKWFTVAQCFRYERTTRGRKREHYQWNLDIIGDPSPAAEAELIACAVNAMDALHVPRSAYRIKYSNRRLLSELLESYNIPADQHASVFLALDKKGKIPKEKIAALLEEAGVPPETLEKIDSIAGVRSLKDLQQLRGESEALAETRSFLEAADAFGISDVLSLDLSVIRGLAYYTGIVFEAFDSENKLRAIFGGGRYDNLLSSIGGKDVTAVGLGFGDVVINELLGELNILNDALVRDAIAVGYMQDAQKECAIKVASGLRKDGRSVHLASKPQKPKAFFGSAADTCSQAIFIGPDDVSAGSVRIKDLESRQEKQVQIESITG